MMVFRRLGLALGILLLTTSAFATQGAQRQATAIANVNGAAKVLAFAQVKVCTYDPANPTTCATTITLFKDPAMTIPFPSNPIQTDQNGNYSYYTNAGNYVEQLCATGATCRTQVVTLGGAGGGSANFPAQIPFTATAGGTPVTAVAANVTALYHSDTIIPNVILNTTFNEGAPGTTINGTVPNIFHGVGTWQLGDPSTQANFNSGGGLILPANGASPTQGPFIDLGVSDYTLNTSVTNQGGSFFMVMLRYQDTGHLVFANLAGSPGTVTLFDFTAPNATQLGTGNFDYSNLTFTLSGSTITVSSPGRTPLVVTDTNYVTATKVGYTLESGANAIIASLHVESGTTSVPGPCAGFLRNDGQCGVGGPASAILMADPQGFGIIPLPGATYQSSTNQANLPGVLITQSEENRPRGVFDPMDIQYAGGLGNASTPAQQQAVIQATLDAAGCAVVHGQIKQAEVIAPASIPLSLSEVHVFSGTDFHCSSDDALFPQCVVTESRPPTTPGFTLTSVATASGGPPATTVYTGTIVNGASNGVAGYAFIITGFTNAANNGTFVAVASTATTVTLTNTAGVAEAHAADAANTLTKDTGNRIFELDSVDTRNCNGDPNFRMGGDNAHIHGFAMSGAGSEAGGHDTGVHVFATHAKVDHNTLNNFGGPALEIDGLDSYGGWNFVTNAALTYIVHDSIPTPGAVGAMECSGEDTMCEWNEVSSGDNGGHIGANYPGVAAFVLSGGSGRFFHNFAQVSWEGLFVACCSSHYLISDFRSDLMAGSAIVTPGGGNSYSAIAINGACQDFAHWVPAGLNPITGDPLGPSSCNAIQDTGAGGDSYANVMGSPQPGGNRSFVGAMMGLGTNSISTSGIENAFPRFSFIVNGLPVNDGRTYDRLGSDTANAAPSLAQVNLGYCQLTGAATVDVSDCSHVVFNDTTPVNIQFLTGGVVGATITIEGTSFDTLIANAPTGFQARILTCQNENIVLGSGGQQVFSYNNIPGTQAWVQQCNNSFPVRSDANFFGNATVPPEQHGAFDGYGNFTSRGSPPLPAPILDCGQCNTPSSFTNCYVEAIFVNGGMETSTAPLCSNQTLVASGPSIMGLKPALFPGWQKVFLYRWSTTQPGIALGLLATFTPSNIPAPDVTAVIDSGQAPIDSTEPSSLGLNWTGTVNSIAVTTFPATLPSGAGFCNPNTLWADDNFVYHCNSSGSGAKRAALTTF